jgi:hypothetical protein
MNSSNSNSLCERAAAHYFDVLGGHIGDDVPGETLAHIRQCVRCQSEIEQLKKALDSEELNDSAQKDYILARSLELQYAYTGVPVTCDNVKPFLPSLADPILEIRVPTPITAHLDNCGQCGDDLETIRQLNLTHKQLCRLGQLFADRSEANPSMCGEAKKAMPFMARLDFEGAPPEILKHVCLCPDCRKSLSDQRHEAVEHIEIRQQTQEFACSDVMHRDIFDYAICYGVNPLDDEYARFRKPLVSHLLNCSDCLGKLQDLHSAVFRILERPASGTVTKFQVSHSAKSDAASGYADWPVRVEITHKASPLKGFKERLSAVNIKPFVKPAAAAAVILFALLFYFRTPIAHAVDLAQIYKAVTKIADIHITRFVPSRATPIQEQWVSKTLNVNIFKTTDEFVLWDISAGNKRVKKIDSGTVESTRLSGDAIAGLREDLESTLDILPFKSLSELPQGARWQKAADSDMGTASGDIRVYDLIWTEKVGDNVVAYRKWRAFIDTKTNLPQRIEWYGKIKDSDDYVLKSFAEISYLSQEQIKAIIREAAF